MSRIRYSLAIALAVFVNLPGTTARSQEPALADRDIVAIRQAFQLWQDLGDDVWPGWTAVRMPMVFITPDHEFAIGFESCPDGFSVVEAKINESPVYAKTRELNERLAASFPFQGVPAVVIGTPQALESSPTRWTLTAVHEMFHVLQMHRGSMAKTNMLEIVTGQNDGSWQLNFPFPYQDVDVMRLFHLEGYPLFLAVTGSDTAAEVRYNVGTALDAGKVIRKYLRETTADDRAWNYKRFQEWKEGIARYTEYRMAELAAARGYQGSEAFRSLQDYAPYTDVFEQSYRPQLNLFKHAGRVARSRTEFYNIGLGKGLALDRLDADWRASYFAPGIWLDDLLASAVGSSTTQSPLQAGAAAPGFALAAIDGLARDLAEVDGKLTLLDFWQPWCPPCLEAMPHLHELSKRYAANLHVWGIVDRGQIDEVKRVAAEQGIDFPTLLDATGDVARKYGIAGYPHTFLIDAGGTIRWQHHGQLSETDRAELEQLIDELLVNDR